MKEDGFSFCMVHAEGSVSFYENHESTYIYIWCTVYERKRLTKT